MADVAVQTPTRAAPQQRKGLSDRAKAERRLAYMLCAPAVFVMIAVTAYPILDAVWLSLHRADLRFPQLDAWVGLDNYKSVLTSSTWWQDVGNTLLITVVSVSIELVLGMLIAQAMYRAIYARTAIRVAVLVPYGAVTVVAAFAWRLAFDPATGFVTHWLGLTTPPLTTRSGSFILIIMAGRACPDGSGTWREVYTSEDDAAAFLRAVGRGDHASAVAVQTREQKRNKERNKITQVSP